MLTPSPFAHTHLKKPAFEDQIQAQAKGLNPVLFPELDEHNVGGLILKIFV
ncbi:hypothetical protein [Peribacillus frigoritolerans]|uniref:hypothetical protein n=1 Tax=Peribacillus frigoritolerans TaxID=450367 RepID=UPI002E1ACB86|nr:hypothetical protein [Peribacillus frigoritolerans]